MKLCASSQSRGATAERLGVDHGAVPEKRLRAHCMNAAEETAHPFERSRVLELRRTATAFGIHGKAESREGVQRCTAARKWRDYRNLARRELGNERVLFANLLVGPASGPIEFHDDGRRVVAPYLVDAILVAAEGQEPPVTSKPDAIERVEHDVRRELGIRVR